MKYFTINDLLKYAETEAPSCGSVGLLYVALAHNIFLYVLESLPPKVFSTFIEENLEMNCGENKDSRFQQTYQYIEYCAGGLPCAIVSGSYEVVVRCGGGGGSEDGGGEPPSRPISTSGNGDTNTNNLDGSDDDGVEAVTVNLRNWIVENCGFSYDNIGLLNVGAGLSFEDGVLNSLGFPKNNLLVPSPDRLLHTGGAIGNVQPDAITIGTYTTVRTNGLLATTEVEIDVCVGCSFVEVKAYSTTVTLSTSNHQIRGLIDAVALTPVGQNMPEGFAPSLFIYTTAIGSISNDVANYATGKGVQLYHGLVSVRPDGSLRVKHVSTENSAARKAVSPSVGQTWDLECPGFSPNQRLDQEVLVE